jgi:hypothetical protein
MFEYVVLGHFRSMLLQVLQRSPIVGRAAKDYCNYYNDKRT